MDFWIKLGFYILYAMFIFLSVISVIESVKGFKKIKNLNGHFRIKYVINSIVHLVAGAIVLLLALLFVPLLFFPLSFLEGLTVVSTLLGFFYFALASSTPILLMICLPCLAVTGITLNRLHRIELKEKRNVWLDVNNFCSIFLTCILLTLMVFAILGI